MKKISINKKTEIDFISLTAHQFKKPLSAIKLSLEMLLKGDFGNINEEQRAILQKILERDETLICLVSDLLNVAKIEGQEHIHHATLVNLEDVLDSVIHFTKEEIERKNITFKLEKPNATIPELMLDKEKMSLAIENIINNAIEYTPIGGSVNVSLTVSQNAVQLNVQDSGIGIPVSETKNVFTKFFRATNAAKEVAAGSGLGLFIAKNIVEANHGKIWFESQENKGSSFFISLPR